MYKNVRWLHFNATSHSFPLSVQTADVAFLLHFGLVFFHTLQFLVHALQVGFHRQTMVVSEAVSVGYIRTGKRSGIERVGFPVIPDEQMFSVRHLEHREFLMFQDIKLFRRHILGHLFHIIAGAVGSLTPDMVSHLLFRVLQHDVVSAPDTSVVHYGKVFILD